MKSPKIVLIGAGNVGFHLGKRFHECGLKILQVFSRKKTKATKLAKAIGAIPISNLDQLNITADIYIVAVHDSAIESVGLQISKKVSDKLIVHTSGATPSTVFKGVFKNYGVFYPLQTFSISRAIDFENIPICIDSSRKKNRIFLTNLANQISSKVYPIDDKQRSILHVAAVFVNNFANHLFHIGQDIVKQENIDFDLLRPLILETALKVQKHNAKDMQTGPAKRGDQDTIDRHLSYLKQHPSYKELYKQLTQSINPSLKIND